MYSTWQDTSTALRGFSDDLLVSASVVISYGALSLDAPDPLVDILDYKTLFLLLVSLLTFSAINRFFSGEKIKIGSSAAKIYPKIISVSVYFSLSLVTTLLFASRTKIRFLLFWTALAYIISLCLITTKQFVCRYLYERANARRDGVTRLLIISDDKSYANAVIDSVIRSHEDRIMILGALGTPIGVGCEYLGTFSSLSKIIGSHSPDMAVFAIKDAVHVGLFNEAVTLCERSCVKVFFLPTAVGYPKAPKGISRIGDLPLINLHATPLDDRAYAIAKRLLDIVFSLLLLVLFSPIMLAAAIGIKLTSDGPIFYRQVRVGRMGRQFKIIKFRSMTVGTDKDVVWSTGTDPRKTRFGNFLRRTSIDELPQLFNVLAGTMSLVGPRPEIPRFVEKFKNEFPLYMVKHYAKPGITGLAQIKGFRGDTSIRDRIRADIDYIENWSLSLDLEILLKTPFHIINKNEKYGSGGTHRSG